MVVYGRAATKTGPAPSVLWGWTAFLLGVAVLRPFQPPPALVLVFVGACFWLGQRLLAALVVQVTIFSLAPTGNLKRI